MKTILLALCTLLGSTAAFAGENWKTYFKNNDAEIMYRTVDCAGNAGGTTRQKIVLKLVNLQNKQVEVSYMKELTFSGTTTTTHADENVFTVQLGPNATVEGNCTTTDSNLYVLVKQLNFTNTKFESFELKNISVKIVQ